jgi:septum formation protein
MLSPIILASQSSIRAEMLHRAGVSFVVEPARIDEKLIKAALQAEDAHPRDIADALAEAKARKVAGRHSETLVLGFDQILALDRELYSKPTTEIEAEAQLCRLRGKTHNLYSAAVIYESEKPVWRHVGQVRLTMRDFSDGYASAYVKRNWDSIRHSVGAYKLEEEGVRLFSRIEGDHFNVLGLPLLEVLSYLTARGTLEG